MPSTYDKIQTTTLGSSQATITFSTIASTYTDLVLVMSMTNTGAANSVNAKFNSDSGSNYSFTDLGGDGSAAGSWRASSQTSLALEFAGAISSTQATYIMQLMNYANTTTYKTTLTRSNNTAYGLDANVGLWRSTSAINRIDLNIANATSFATGSMFTLYGIKAA
jgi:hypothetical protein